MAARELARRGASVLLVDKSNFPRYKVCGCCLNPRSLRLLHASGLGSLASDLHAVPLTRVCLAAQRSRAEISLPHGAAVSREAFDAALINAAIAAGAAFWPGAAAHLLPTAPENDRRLLRLKFGQREFQVACRVVLAANGLAGRIEELPPSAEQGPETQAWSPESRIGAGTIAECPCGTYESRTIYMACGQEGYVGLVQIEDGRLDVAAALDPLAVKSADGIGNLAASIIERAGLPDVAGLRQLPWKGTPHLTRSAPRLAGERLFILGDAAGYIEPFTGEGIAWALSSARLAAPLAIRGAHQWQPSLIARWKATYRRKVTPRQTVCRITAALLRRPRLTRQVVRALSIMPWLTRPLFKLMYRD